MTTPDQMWETYTSTWGPIDDRVRDDLLARSLSVDCTYTDPNIHAEGQRAIAEYMAGFQAQMPGARFATQTFAGHHDVALVEWQMLDAKGHAIGTGMSVGHFGEDGRLTSIAGFFATPEA